MRHMFEGWVDAWNSRDEERVSSFYSDTVILCQPGPKKTLIGRRHVIDRYRDFNLMSDDSEMIIRDLYVDGVTAILEVSLVGTNTGPFLDYVPTGRMIDLETCLVFKVAGGKIIKQTTYLDTATVLRSLGHISVPSARAEAA